MRLVLKLCTRQSLSRSDNAEFGQQQKHIVTEYDIDGIMFYSRSCMYQTFIFFPSLTEMQFWFSSQQKPQKHSSLFNFLISVVFFYGRNTVLIEYQFRMSIDTVFPFFLKRETVQQKHSIYRSFFYRRNTVFMELWLWFFSQLDENFLHQQFYFRVTSTYCCRMVRPFLFLSIYIFRSFCR